MGDLNFTTQQCLRALQRLGFTFSNRRGGRHNKLIPPQEILRVLSGAQPRFIMVPRHRELRCQNEIVRELKVMGGESLVEKFKQNL